MGRSPWVVPGSRSSPVESSSWDLTGGRRGALMASNSGDNGSEGPGGGRSWVVSGTEGQYLVAGLPSSTTFGFMVRASTMVGEGPFGTRVTQRVQSKAPAAIASFNDNTVSSMCFSSCALMLLLFFQNIYGGLE